MKKLDFLLVGFCKSGTSSFDALLRQDRRILLSETKETQYISNHSEMKMDNFWNIFYPNYKRNKCIGGIEPTYCFSARKVAEKFGRDIKLIFMMRNPVKAHYSQFKMRTRGEGNVKIDEIYRKYSADQLPQMYEEYVRRFIKEDKAQIRDDFLYDRWIKEYLKYFKLEQMYFILFEDFIENPQTVMDGVYKFLGLKPQKTGAIRQVNSDLGISKDRISRLINKRVSIWMKRWNHCTTIREAFLGLRNKCYKYTLILNDAPMSDKAEYMLSVHYRNTIQNMERLLKRDLSQIW